jgi:hypothetical protein
MTGAGGCGALDGGAGAGGTDAARTGVGVGTLGVGVELVLDDVVGVSLDCDFVTATAFFSVSFAFASVFTFSGTAWGDVFCPPHVPVHAHIYTVVSD